MGKWENYLENKSIFETFEMVSGSRIFPYFLKWTNKRDVSREAGYVFKRPQNYAARPVKAFFAKWKFLMEMNVRKREFKRSKGKYKKEKSKLFRFNLFSLLMEYFRYNGVDIADNEKALLEMILINENYRNLLSDLSDKNIRATEFVQNVITAIRSGHQDSGLKMLKMLEIKEEEIRGDFHVELNRLQRKVNKDQISSDEYEPIINDLTERYFYAPLRKLPLIFDEKEEFVLLLLHFLISEDLMDKLGQTLPDWKRQSVTLDLIGSGFSTLKESLEVSRRR